MDVKLFVDGNRIVMKDFPANILGRAIVGAVTTLKGVDEDWKEIEVKISR
ncbi:MAG: hypothetical protein ACE5OY_07870 [Candidatus Bathyarchaeia archaeon]